METPKHPYDEKTLARFWAKVDKSGGPDACWLWKDSRNSGGYGTFRIDAETKVGAHVVSFIIANRTHDSSLDVMHSCNNPPCVNPNHLSQGTRKRNLMDAAAQGRMSAPKPWNTGSLNLNARLTPEVVREARERFSANVESRHQIAKRLRINQRSAVLMLRGATWKDAGGPLSPVGAKTSPGESNAKAKVTEKDVLQIRKLYERGMKQKDIAALFKVSQITVSQIARRITWKHVPDSET